jgi:UDP-N-acetyl-2-amino-2-deoxyglucuronate dehydrogenase
MSSPDKNKLFGLIGAAGFVAPRHMEAIQFNGQKLVASLDPSDNVGVLDRYFPEAHFFTEFERFDRHLDKRRRTGSGIDYLSICSPNYLHDSHIRFGLRSGAHVICEKPLVLNPWNLDALGAMERESDKSVYSILQLRLHPSIIALNSMVENSPVDHTFDVELTYIAARGNWYHASWKADLSKSGGIITNLGIHFFDTLLWIFGPMKESKLFVYDNDRASGYLELKRARIKWFLSTDVRTLPPSDIEMGRKTLRTMRVDTKMVDFSQGFEDLHIRSYAEILSLNGFGLEENRPAIELCHHVRNQKLSPLNDCAHSLIG